MPLTDELLDNIRANEIQQLGFFTRLWANGSIIKTSRLRSLAHITPGEPTVFKPNTILQTLPFGIIFMFISFAALKGLSFSGLQLVGGLLLTSILLIGIYFVLKQVLYSMRLNYTITLTRQGIAFNDDFFSWADIQETAILHLPTGKSGTDYLVLLFKDNNYEKWNLTNFRSFPWLFNEKLATHIEYFKALQ
jgi:hypothetical protein